MSQLRLSQRRVVVAQPSESTSRYNAASVIERISAANATVFAGSFRSARAAAIRASNDAASRRSSARVRTVDGYTGKPPASPALLSKSNFNPFMVVTQGNKKPLVKVRQGLRRYDGAV
jgi:hypothetical protein